MAKKKKIPKLSERQLTSLMILGLVSKPNDLTPILMYSKSYASFSEKEWWVTPPLYNKESSNFMSYSVDVRTYRALARKGIVDHLVQKTEIKGYRSSSNYYGNLTVFGWKVFWHYVSALLEERSEYLAEKAEYEKRLSQFTIEFSYTVSFNGKRTLNVEAGSGPVAIKKANVKSFSMYVPDDAKIVIAPKEEWEIVSSPPSIYPYEFRICLPDNFWGFLDEMVAEHNK